MIGAEFRRAALALAGAQEGAHQGHADFRRAGRIFATLGFPDADTAMVKLRPEQQAMLLDAWPDLFRPAAGAWGRQGSTLLRLEGAAPDIVAGALRMAFDAAVRPPRRR